MSPHPYLYAYCHALYSFPLILSRSTGPLLVCGCRAGPFRFSCPAVPMVPSCPVVLAVLPYSCPVASMMPLNPSPAFPLTQPATTCLLRHRGLCSQGQCSGFWGPPSSALSPPASVKFMPQGPVPSLFFQSQAPFSVCPVTPPCGFAYPALPQFLP